MTVKKSIDWEAVEIQYRAGIRSLKDIGVEFGVSDAGILKRAKRDGWVRDLKAKIQAKADAKVSASLVSGEVSAQTKIAEAQVIDVESTVIARIRLSHRTDIARSRALAMSLLSELEIETGNIDLFEELGELLRSEDDKGQDRRNDIYRKVISSAGRIDSMKKLAEVLKTLIGLEREAYGIVDAQKIDLNAKIDSNRKPQELTDDELYAIAKGSGAGTAHTA
jgi:hypothetical protein